MMSALVNFLRAIGSVFCIFPSSTPPLRSWLPRRSFADDHQRIRQGWAIGLRVFDKAMDDELARLNGLCN